MRILVLSQYFWPESFRINDVVAGLVERGHALTVYTGMPNYPGGRFFDGYGFFGPRREKYRGAEVRRAPLLARNKTIVAALVGLGPDMAVHAIQGEQTLLKLVALLLKLLELRLRSLQSLLEISLFPPGD